MDVQPFSRSRSGYSLIEVMIALLILSIGMLGVGGMVLGASKDTRGAFYRTKAVALAWDMAERIRANRTAGIAYAVDQTGDGTDNSCSASSTNATPLACTVESLAAHDIFEWKTALVDKERGLPQGMGSIEFNNATSPPTYTITVNWSDGIVEADTEGAPSVSVVTQL
ncbi:MAG TPA: type IV pilus modification protein PilV [Gammaproteobacteria bacterium]